MHERSARRKPIWKGRHASYLPFAAYDIARSINVKAVKSWVALLSNSTPSINRLFSVQNSAAAASAWALIAGDHEPFRERSSKPPVVHISRPHLVCASTSCERLGSGSAASLSQLVEAHTRWGREI